MPEPTTTTTEETSVDNTTTEEPYDKDRAMELIRKLRQEAKQATAQMKEYEQLRKEKETREQSELTEQQKLAQRITQMEAELKWERQEKADRLLEFQIERHASQLGIVDPEAALKLMDRAQLEFDQEGNPTNIPDTLKTLVKSKPYLASQQPAVTTPSGVGLNPTNPGSRSATATQSKPTYKREQFLDRAFYIQNKSDMMAAMKEGRIVD